VPNPYYTNPAVFIQGDIIRAVEVDAELNSLESAMDLVEIDVNRSLTVPIGESLEILEDAAARANTIMAFDVSGNVDLSRTLTAFDADVAQTAADRVQTAIDRLAALNSATLANGAIATTTAHVVITNSDVVITTAHAASTADDVITTNANVVTTNNNVTSTNADVVTTNNNVVLTNANVVSTAADVVTTNNDVTSTNADVVSTNTDAAIALSAIATTNADVISTNADVVTTNNDTIQTAADRVQTGIDALATAADLEATNLNNIASAADRVQTGIDVGLAQAAQAAAEAAQVAAELAFDSADDIYLGAKAVEPTVDNDGDPLVVGAWYYGTSDFITRIYNGTAWDTLSSPIATSTSVAFINAAKNLIHTQNITAKIELRSIT